MAKKLVIVSGYFNPIHSGHISLFKEAKELGDELIVILNNDSQVRMKGSVPFMDENERKIVTESIKYVDHVIVAIDKDGTVCKTIERIHSIFLAEGVSFIFANGGDRKEGNVPEYNVCQDLQIEMKYNVGGGKSQSSSWLLQKTRKCKKHDEDLVYCKKCLEIKNE